MNDEVSVVRMGGWVTYVCGVPGMTATGEVVHMEWDPDTRMIVVRITVVDTTEVAG